MLFYNFKTRRTRKHSYFSSGCFDRILPYKYRHKISIYFRGRGILVLVLHSNINILSYVQNFWIDLYLGYIKSFKKGL